MSKLEMGIGVLAWLIFWFAWLFLGLLVLIKWTKEDDLNN